MRVVALDDPELAEGELAAIAHKAASSHTLKVIHIVDVEDEGVRQSLAKGAQIVHDQMVLYPALKFRQFVVAMVDREWDQSELDVLMGLDDAIDAVLVVSRSTDFVVQLESFEEESMAADLAHALAVSGLSEETLGRRNWIVGASAVYYRREPLVAALEAYHVQFFLKKNLLSPLPASHTECDEGRVWVREKLLGRAEHLYWIERAPLGGSILSEIRIDRELFREVQPELLVDSLRSFATQNANHHIDIAKEQIERNRTEHLSIVSEELTKETENVLLRALRLASAEKFVECVRSELNTPLQGLQVALSAAEEDAEAEQQEIQGIEDELIRSIRSLPYPVALAARSLGFGALGIAAYQVLVQLLSLDPNFAVLGLLGALAFGIPLLVQYRAQLARIGELRERYLTLVERRVKGRVTLMILEAAIEEIHEIQRFAGLGSDTLGGSLRSLRQVLEALLERYQKRVTDRVFGEVESTRLSMMLPTIQDMPTEALVEQFPLKSDYGLPKLVMEVLLREQFPAVPDIDEIDRELIGEFEKALKTSLWPDLQALLKGSLTTWNTAETLLQRSVTPIVLRGQFGADKESVVRKACYYRETGGLLEEFFLKTSIDGYLSSSDRNGVVQIAMRPVPTKLVGGGANDNESN